MSFQKMTRTISPRGNEGDERLILSFDGTDVLNLNQSLIKWLEFKANDVKFLALIVNTETKQIGFTIADTKINDDYHKLVISQQSSKNAAGEKIMYDTLKVQCSISTNQAVIEGYITRNKFIISDVETAEIDNEIYYLNESVEEFPSRERSVKPEVTPVSKIEDEQF